MLLAKLVLTILSLDYEEAFVISKPGLPGAHPLAALMWFQLLVTDQITAVLFAWLQSVKCGTLLGGTHCVQNMGHWAFSGRQEVHQL